jgi:sporulation protein YlmC with PRC-barrel domain
MNLPAGRRLWAALELLDRQLVDRDGHLVGKVDDLELELPDEPDGLPVVTAIVSGAGALSGQIGGDAGHWLAAVERRLSRGDEPSRIPFALVRSIGSAVEVGGSREELETNRGERWARDVIIAKIPGSGHATE